MPTHIAFPDHDIADRADDDAFPLITLVFVAILVAQFAVIFAAPKAAAAVTAFFLPYSGASAIGS